MNKSLVALLMLGAVISSPVLAASPQPGETLAEKQEISIWWLDTLKTADPQLNEDTTGGEIGRQIFEGLYTVTADGSLRPGVATSHTLSDDGLTYTFTLRPEAKWSNGEPVTAKDFVYAWRRLVDPKTASPYAWYLPLMKVKNAQAVIDGTVPPEELGVTAVDDHTLQVVIDQPTPYFVLTTTHGSVLPVLQSVVEAHGDQWTLAGNLVGNGAYTLTEGGLGEQTILTRNPNYWNDAETIIEKIVYKVVNDENLALTRYLAGELDIGPVPSGQYPRLESEYPAEVFSVPRGCTYGYLFNVSEKGPDFLKDVRVRKALSYAIDRDVVIDNILQAGQTPAYSWTHEATAGFVAPTIDYGTWTQAERNAKAVELLTEAGYGKDNPLKLTLSYNTSEGHKKIAIAVQQFWKAIGVEATLENMEWKVYQDKLGQQDFQVGRYAWCADYDEASTFLDYFRSTGSNDGKFNNADYDATLDAAAKAADPQPLYTKAEEILSEEMPLAPVYFYASVGMVKPDVRGFPVTSLSQDYYVKDMYRVKP